MAFERQQCESCGEHEVETIVTKCGESKLQCRACGTEQRRSINVRKNKKKFTHLRYDFSWVRCAFCTLLGQFETRAESDGGITLECIACKTERRDSDNVRNNKKNHVFHVEYGQVQWPVCPSCNYNSLHHPEDPVKELHLYGAVEPTEVGSAYVVCRVPTCKGGALLKFHRPAIC